MENKIILINVGTNGVAERKSKTLKMRERVRDL